MTMPLCSSSVAAAASDRSSRGPLKVGSLSIGSRSAGLSAPPGAHAPLQARTSHVIIAAFLSALLLVGGSPSNAADITVDELSRLRTDATANATTLLARREAFQQLMASFPRVAGVTTESAVVGGVPGLWVRPRSSTPSGRSVIYLHGGGYYSGSSVTHRNLAAALALRSHAAVFVPDYRLAPEYRFPAQVEDAERVYDALGRDRRACSIAIAGESAGGGLAVSLVSRLKAAGRPLPGALFVMSPMLDFNANSPSMVARAATDPVVKPAGVHAIAEVFLGGVDSRPPGSTPLNDDFHSFPPTLIQVGNDETLLDDALRLATATSRAGVDTRLHVTTGVIHQCRRFRRSSRLRAPRLQRAQTFSWTVSARTGSKDARHKIDAWWRTTRTPELKHGRHSVRQRTGSKHVDSGISKTRTPTSVMRGWRTAPGDDDNYVYAIALQK